MEEIRCWLIRPPALSVIPKATWQWWNSPPCHSVHPPSTRLCRCVGCYQLGDTKHNSNPDLGTLVQADSSDSVNNDWCQHVVSSKPSQIRTNFEERAQEPGNFPPIQHSVTGRRVSVARKPVSCQSNHLAMLVKKATSLSTRRFHTQAGSNEFEM